MYKLRIVVVILIVWASLMAVEDVHGYTIGDLEYLENKLIELEDKQYHASKMAESARELGYRENNQIIIDAKKIWDATEKEKIALGSVIDTLNKQKEVESEKLRVEKEAKRELENSRKRLVYDAHTPTNLSVDDFNYLLRKTKLAGNGESFKYIEDNNSVNGVFALAVATQESGAGRHNANRNNFWGRRAVGGGWMAWNTPDESIKSFGVYMSGPLYTNKNIEQIARTYCPPTHEDWAMKIRWHMNNYWKQLNY